MVSQCFYKPIIEHGPHPSNTLLFSTTFKLTSVAEEAPVIFNLCPQFINPCARQTGAGEDWGAPKRGARSR
tara:strand:- start:4 stop:216 length:213 start_codon:yes stop_codon:yes gene_type:complete